MLERKFVHVIAVKRSIILDSGKRKGKKKKTKGNSIEYIQTLTISLKDCRSSFFGKKTDRNGMLSLQKDLATRQLCNHNNMIITEQNKRREKKVKQTGKRVGQCRQQH